MNVKKSRPMSEEVEGQLITLYHFASLAIEAGPEKMAFKSAKIQNGILYIRRAGVGYLAIDPSARGARKLCEVDDDLTPREGLFSIDLRDIESAVYSLEECLLRRNVLDPNEF